MADVSRCAGPLPEPLLALTPGVRFPEIRHGTGVLFVPLFSDGDMARRFLVQVPGDVRLAILRSQQELGAWLLIMLRSGKTMIGLDPGGANTRALPTADAIRSVAAAVQE